MRWWTRQPAPMSRHGRSIAQTVTLRGKTRSPRRSPTGTTATHIAARSGHRRRWRIDLPGWWRCVRDGMLMDQDHQVSNGIQVPQSFRQMPRWWTDSSWLDSIPGIASAMCRRWRLQITGEPVHGSNALVFPVRQSDSMFVLRLTPPGNEVAEQVAALRFWDGQGTVELVDADVDIGAMLLERLDGTRSLLHIPACEAMVILGAMMRRLAVPAPPDVVSTADVVDSRVATLRRDWLDLGRPFDESFLRQASVVASTLRRSESALAVNADLHSAQVLRGVRESWLTVDPVLMRGDIAFDLARVLWTRVDEMPDRKSIVDHFEAAVEAARIGLDHGRDWVLFRAVDYWLWALRAGFTEDPERCRRLVMTFGA
jgi:streptomycin 6-kinase